ncbi:hypothetical protein EDF87_12540 [Pseudomonas helmanticensis]|uniref:Phage integrase family protein n=1 Tax=Pseudomonas helmanticensis TaxID=1471381 RepID=A0A4R7UU11_9PSED|nr:site-specific integrase [Pseudomonas helmanticensis]TDV37504.1 hypothetical protein EDF87_12540 [Pseudomonas helmanticensis]
MKLLTTKLQMDQFQKKISAEQDPLRPEDIALDLDATARHAPKRRIFWDDDRLVQLGRPSIYCSRLLSNLTQESKYSFKKTLLEYRDEKSASSDMVMRLVGAMLTASKEHPPTVFDSQWASQALKFTSFRQLKRPIRLFLEYWRSRYPTAVGEEMLNLLAQARGVPITSNNAESDDPDKSWLTDEEYDDLLRVTWDHYDRSGATQPALIRLLSMQYARRPSQLSNLKFGDLKAGSSKVIAELAENEIHFPAAKERYVEIEFRGGKFEAHPIADHLWNLLTIQRINIKILFEQSLNLTLTTDEVESLPVFTTQDRVLKAADTLRNTLSLNPREHLDDQLFHTVPTYLGRVIAFSRNMPIFPKRGNLTPESTRSLLPVSRRTGKPILLTAIRLRHTRIRQLARQGVPKPILSYWLGHNDDDALKSYFNDPAEKARQIDERISPGLAPIAQAFHGRIIASDEEATHPSDPLKRLELAKDGFLSYVGRCGKFSFCATTSIPIPCYRCRNFEPLVTAPHEEVLEALRYRQAQEQEVIKPGSLRNLLIPIDLSTDIRAVERCIALCKAKREQE